MNVIFDLGNVVIDWNVKKNLHSLEMPLAVQQEIKTQLFGHADWFDLDCGTQTEPQVIANIVARSTLTEEQVKLALLKAKQSLDILDESVQLMQEASKAGHKLYCLSNMSVETYNHIKHHDFLNLSYYGLIIGGLIPALAFGIGAILQKYSNDIGISQSYYLVCFSIGIALTSVISAFVFSNNVFSYKAGAFAIGHGFLFGIGFVALAVGLTVFQMPVSKLVPLANMSTLVTVICGLIIFSEYAKLNVVNLFLGALLIIAGGIIVSKA